MDQRGLDYQIIVFQKCLVDTLGSIFSLVRHTPPGTFSSYYVIKKGGRLLIELLKFISIYHYLTSLDKTFT